MYIFIYFLSLFINNRNLLSHHFLGKKWTLMDKALANLWAKTAKDNDPEWHPLILHVLDVAASADAGLR